jgi:hypothetical protein
VVAATRAAVPSKARTRGVGSPPRARLPPARLAELPRDLRGDRGGEGLADRGRERLDRRGRRAFAARPRLPHARERGPHPLRDGLVHRSAEARALARIDELGERARHHPAGCRVGGVAHDGAQPLLRLGRVELGEHAAHRGAADALRALVELVLRLLLLLGPLRAGDRRRRLPGAASDAGVEREDR